MSLFLAFLLASQAASPASAGAPECELADDRCEAELYLGRAKTAKSDGHRAMRLFVAHQVYLTSFDEVGETTPVAAKQAAARQSAPPSGTETSEATAPSAGAATAKAPPPASAPPAPATNAAGATNTKSNASEATVDALAKGTSARADATVRPQPSREEQRARLLLRVGVGTLVPGALLFIPMAGLLGRRAAGERELEVLNLDTAGRPTSAAEDATAAALGQRYTNLTAAVIVLGLTGGALAVTGAVLLTMDARPRRVAVAPWGARGLGGLVLTGRF
ncbi:hypothetical protein OV090_24810 [Nannocystis sp. RBIL2]|uniref:hypothetical protein n=1 Tax=Nannocystis sp. RBIL2 TaxID=2996788 RepID=UPI002270DEE0|nr:hypothetical protein [Nannocystis sp. RBIL2]MCY1067987.1 hypothetical protein [Nannocystis sp. RBIL2]